MAGERFGEATLDARLRDLDSRKHIKVSLTYGTLYARGYGDDYDVLILGSGGGLVLRERLDFHDLRRHVEGALEAGEGATTDYDLFPSRFLR